MCKYYIRSVLHMKLSPLQIARYQYAPKLPGMLRNGISEISVRNGGATESVADQDKIKALFPTEPIYVHFYSPRWICRMGNYRTYDEANAILQQVKKLGYKQACIVKGKISVAY